MDDLQLALFALGLIAFVAVLLICIGRGWV